MINNDIFRKLRYIFDLGDDDVIKLFALAEAEVTREQVCNWLKKDDDDQFTTINDKDFATFLNGFINKYRGKRDGPQPKPEKRLTNNIILRKLKIALNMKDEDILRMFEKADFDVSKSELSALFRKPDQKQYRECGDQFMRNFLFGLQKEHRKA